MHTPYTSVSLDCGPGWTVVGCWSSMLPRFNDGELAVSGHSELLKSDIEICSNADAIPAADGMG